MVIGDMLGDKDIPSDTVNPQLGDGQDVGYAKNMEKSP